MAYSDVSVAILAGGAGTRFWPASRVNRPKPFIDLLGKGPLITQTTERVLGLVERERVFYVVGEHLLEATRDCAPVGMGSQVLVEPVARNTLGAVLLTLAHVRTRLGHGRVIVLPSDHVVGDVGLFQATLERGLELAASRIVTLGIVPTRPETGFGYIQAGELLDEPGISKKHAPAHKVRRFVEKPDAATAVGFLAAGGFFWNAGMFIFDSDFLLERIRDVNPSLVEVVHQMEAILSTRPGDREALRDVMEPLPSVNIDKAVMEKVSEHLAVIPAHFPWSDVGTWDALFEGLNPGASFTGGDVLQIGGNDNVVVSAPGAPMVAALNVSNLVVVATRDAVLVTRRGGGQEVGGLVAELKRAGRTDLL